MPMTIRRAFPVEPTFLVFHVARMVAAAAMPLALAVQSRPAGAQPVAVPGTVRATGSASITVVPDLAIVTVQFAANGRTPASAGQAAARSANAIRAAIGALGIPADSMPSSGPPGSWLNRSAMEVRNNGRDTTYVTTDAFTVRIRDLSLVNRVVDTALMQGAQTISNVEFLATDTRSAQLEAIRRATADARIQASAAAEAADRAVGQAQELTVDGPAGPVAFHRAADAAMAMSRAEVATTIVAPELKVTVTVSGRWELVARGSP